MAVRTKNSNFARVGRGHAQYTCMRAFAGLWQPYRFKAFYGGRGGAKSHQFAEALVMMVASKGLRVLCCREIQKSIKTSVKQLLEDKVDLLGLRDMFHSTDTGLSCPSSGGEFLFAGLRTNPDSVKSMEGIDVAWVEEADRVSQRSLDLLIPTIRKPGSEIWLSFNRHREDDPVDKMFVQDQIMRNRPDVLVRQVSWRDNPYFPDELRVELEWDKRRDWDKYQHIWEGHPLKISEAQVFTNWSLDDLDDLVQQTGSRPRLGADWGFASDPNVLVECHVFHDKRLVYFSDEAYKVRCRIDEIPALFAGDDPTEMARWNNPWKHRGVPSALKRPIVGDSSRPDTIQYLADRGFTIRGARKGPGSIDEGVEFLKSYDIVCHPNRVPHVVNELGLYQYEVDEHTGEVLPTLKDKDNHTIDAARYAVEGERRPSVASAGASVWSSNETILGDY